MSWFYSKSAFVYDADAQAYFDQIALAGSTIDSTAKMAINDFVLGCKTDSIWTLLQDIGPLCGDDLTGALVKLKKLSSAWTYTSTGFVGGDYSQATGLTGGTGRYLTTGVLANALTTNSTGIGVYDRNTVDSTTNQHGVTSGGGNRLSLYAPYSDNKVYSSQYSIAGELGSAALTGAIGFVFSRRPSGVSHAIDRNGSVIASTGTVSGSLPAVDIVFFGNNNDGAKSASCNHTLAFLCLTLGMNDPQSASFYTRVQALQTALGRNV